MQQGHRDHDHSSPVETYLTALRRAKRLAIGPYLLPLAALRADVARLYSTYADQAQDGGYPEFLRIWSSSNFALVHLGTPIPFGRDSWINAWYALLLEYAHQSESIAFAVYALATLWRTQPGHLGPKVPVPITPLGLEWLVDRIDEVVRDAGANKERGMHMSDVVEVLKHAIQNNMFVLTAWVGGDHNAQSIPTANNHRWTQGVAGDGWTRQLALTHHPPETAQPSTATSAPASLTNTCNNALSGMAYIRHTLQRHAQSPLLPAPTLARLDTHAHRYAAHRDVLVQVGVVAPAASTSLCTQETQAHQHANTRHPPPHQVAPPHLTHLTGTLQRTLAGYYSERAASMRDAVDKIRKVGGRKRKDHDGKSPPHLGNPAGSGSRTKGLHGRGFEPPVVHFNKGGRPNDVTRWAMGREDVGLGLGQDGSRTSGSLDDEDAMQVDL